MKTYAGFPVLYLRTVKLNIVTHKMMTDRNRMLSYLFEQER